MKNIATHPAPVWGPKANFILRADLDAFGMAGRIEQLWARQTDHDTFEICCIPFFTYGISLGDKVEADSEHYVQRVIIKGGHKTLRVAITEDKEDDCHEILHGWADGTGLLYEWHGASYLAVDLPPDSLNRLDIDLVNQLASGGAIFYEIDD
jgi:hypothetical protein